MRDKGRSIESLHREYSDAVHNIRHYSGLRFVIFSVFVAVMGGITLIAFSDSGKYVPFAIQFAKVSAILITLVFWIYEERASIMFSHFSRIAIELERKLGYSQITTRPVGKFPIVEAKYVTRVFFIIWLIIWTYALFSSW